jgi:hypothetical protein
MDRDVSKINKKFDLAGKTALITGGAGLLGVEHVAAPEVASLL